MMCQIFTSLKNFVTNLKFIPKRAIINEIIAIKTRIEQISAQAGWMSKASQTLPCAKASVALVQPQVGHGIPYICLKPQRPRKSPISRLECAAIAKEAKNKASTAKTIAAITRCLPEARKINFDLLIYWLEYITMLEYAKGRKK